MKSLIEVLKFKLAVKVAANDLMMTSRRPQGVAVNFKDFILKF